MILMFFLEIVRFCSLFHGLSCLLFCCSLLCLCFQLLPSVAASVAAAVVSAGLLEHPAKDAAMIPANNNAAILSYCLSPFSFIYRSFPSLVYARAFTIRSSACSTVDFGQAMFIRRNPSPSGPKVLPLLNPSFTVSTKNLFSSS